jgi:hypothetical protein
LSFFKNKTLSVEFDAGAYTHPLRTFPQEKKEKNQLEPESQRVKTYRFYF